MATTTRKATARNAAAPVAEVPTQEPTVIVKDGLCTITFRTDLGVHVKSESGKSRMVAKTGQVKVDGVVIQVNAYRVIPKAERG